MCWTPGSRHNLKYKIINVKKLGGKKSKTNPFFSCSFPLLFMFTLSLPRLLLFFFILLQPTFLFWYLNDKRKRIMKMHNIKQEYKGSKGEDDWSSNIPSSAFSSSAILDQLKFLELSIWAPAGTSLIVRIVDHIFPIHTRGLEVKRIQHMTLKIKGANRDSVP